MAETMTTHDAHRAANQAISLTLLSQRAVVPGFTDKFIESYPFESASAHIVTQCALVRQKKRSSFNCESRNIDCLEVDLLL